MSTLQTLQIWKYFIAFQIWTQLHNLGLKKLKIKVKNLGIYIGKCKVVLALLLANIIQQSSV